MIKFTINGTEYQAEEGMTWEQWVNSEYNDDVFYITGNYVYYSATGTTVFNSGIPVNITYVIIENGSYAALPAGGGGGN